MYAVKIGHCDWFNKRPDWTIAEWDELRWKRQTENDWKKGRVRRLMSR